MLRAFFDFLMERRGQPVVLIGYGLLKFLIQLFKTDGVDGYDESAGVGHILSTLAKEQHLVDVERDVGRKAQQDGIADADRHGDTRGQAGQLHQILSLADAVDQQFVVLLAVRSVDDEHLCERLGQHDIFSRQMVDADEQLLRHRLVADDVHGATARTISQDYHRQAAGVDNLRHLPEEELGLARTRPHGTMLLFSWDGR